MEPRVTIAV